jgi:hypothetical protein
MNLDTNVEKFLATLIIMGFIKTPTPHKNLSIAVQNSIFKVMIRDQDKDQKQVFIYRKDKLENLEYEGFFTVSEALRHKNKG